MTTTITIAFGDGIGPEIMEVTLKILKEAEAKITIETIELGQKLYEQGFSSGIPNEAWATIKKNKILFKSPITTPQGGGYKSLNVTLRKALGLYANVRPCIAFHPYVQTQHPKMNLVIIRENEEDIYAGIEYRQTHNTYQSLKLISATGSERIVRYAFDYAVRNNRRKVTCLSKDNIMKFSDGIFHKVFDMVAKEYPEIKTEHYIIDIGTARLASKPEIFDVLVTSNLYGDILSDVAAEISGSVGLAGSANIGAEFAMFEAIHGSAPDISGKKIANPSGLINAAIMMLVHIGQPEVATTIHNALLKTLEDGMHTKDIYNDKISTKLCSTDEFGEAVIARLGQFPTKMEKVNYKPTTDQTTNKYVINVDRSVPKTLYGVDIFLDWEGNANQLAMIITKLTDATLKLQSISLKGLSVWPQSTALVQQGDHWQLRFVPSTQKAPVHHQDILYLLQKLQSSNFDFIKTENLYMFADQLGFSLGQGE